MENSCFCCGENHNVWICHNYNENLVIDKITREIVEGDKNFYYIKNLFNELGFSKCKSISRKFGYLSNLPKETHVVLCTTELFIQNGMTYDEFLSNDLMSDETIHDFNHHLYIPQEYAEITAERNRIWERYFLPIIQQPLFLGLLVRSKFNELVRKTFRDRDLLLRNRQQLLMDSVFEELISVSQINIIENEDENQEEDEDEESRPRVMTEEIRNAIRERFGTQEQITNTDNDNDLQHNRNSEEEYTIEIQNESFDRVIRWIDVDIKFTPIKIEEWGENLPKMECCICFENKHKFDSVSLICKHTICSDCTATLITNHSNSCPLCRTKITNLEVYSSDIERKFLHHEIQIYKTYFDRFR